MNMTHREKVLIGALAAAVLIYAEYTFLINGQLNSIQANTAYKGDLDARVQQLKNAGETEQNLDAQLAQVMPSTTAVMDRYFTDTTQEEIILLMNDLLADSGVSVRGINFSPPAEFTLGESTFSKVSISMDYTSSYSSLTRFMKRVWDFPKMITVDNVVMSSNGSDGLSGTMALGFTYLTGYEGIGYKDNLYQIMPDDTFFKENPFVTSAGAGDFRLNYLFTGGKEPGEAAYVPYEDIKGHWAEQEINSFGEQGLLPASQSKTFGPDAAITRGEFIIMLDRIYQWPMPENPVDLTQFSDYAALGSYENSIAKAIYKGFLGGVVVGTTDNTLRPRDPITYEEVEFIVRKLKNQPEFQWEQVEPQFNAEKGVTTQGATDKKLTMTKAEAVFLMTKIK